MRLGKLALISTVLLLILPSPAKPQSPQNTSQPATPTIQVYSRETIVDVVVTGKNGQVIRDLKQSNFTIKEDGKPQSIRSFAEYGPTPSTPLITPRLPSGVQTNFQASPTNGPVNIVLIDAMHSDWVGTIRSLQATSAYVSRMPEGTQLAIFWLSMSGLHLLQGFTSDRDLLLAALQIKRTDIGSNTSCHTVDWGTIEALNQIAQYVAGIKGKKNLIWFTPGIPVYLMRDGGYGWGQTSSCHDTSQPIASAGNPFPVDIPNASEQTIALYNGPTLFMGNDDGLNMGMVHRLMDTYELFSTEQIAVSPVEPHGVIGLGLGSLAAEEVAEQSGGIAQYNSNDLAARLAQAVDQGSRYYTVSYIPPRRKDDGHYHTITVEVNQPGAHLVYRKGYNAEDPRQPKQFSGPDLIKAALEGKAPAATQLLFDAKLAPGDPSATPPPVATSAKAKGKSNTPRILYDLVLGLPQSQITYGRGPSGTHTVNLEFAFDAYDLNGKFLGSHSQSVSLALDRSQFSAFILDPVIFHEQISFLPGPLFLRVGILDHTSNRVGSLEIPLTVSRQGARALSPGNASHGPPPCPPRCPLTKPTAQ